VVALIAGVDGADPGGRIGILGGWAAAGNRSIVGPVGKRVVTSGVWMLYRCVTLMGPGRVVAVGDDFEEWYRSVEPKLRRALTAAYGPDRGREATAEALAWAWEHRDRLERIDRPVAYLYRVGQSRTRLRRRRFLGGRAEWSEPWIEPGLAAGLAALSERQRVAVVLVHSYAWTMAEVADVLGVKVTTVQNHLERGLARLRSTLEVSPDV
jgi:DNA-directed RNA polymerase specialized sigma24 family protein